MRLALTTSWETRNVTKSAITKHVPMMEATVKSHVLMVACPVGSVMASVTKRAKSKIADSMYLIATSLLAVLMGVNYR